MCNISLEMSLKSGKHHSKYHSGRTVSSCPAGYLMVFKPFNKQNLSSDCSSAHLQAPTASLLELPVFLNERSCFIILLLSPLCH
jgi:hypothetical protein